MRILLQKKTKSQLCTVDFRLWPYLKKRMTFSMGPLGLYDSISDSKSFPRVERVESRRMVSNSSNPEARTVSIKSSAAARLPSFTLQQAMLYFAHCTSSFDANSERTRPPPGFGAPPVGCREDAVRARPRSHPLPFNFSDNVNMSKAPL